jgi:hypothetical protein
MITKMSETKKIVGLGYVFPIHNQDKIFLSL